MIWTLIIRRLGYMIFTLLIISIISFVIIQLPPGDFLTSLVLRMEAQGDEIAADQIEVLRERYGLGDPPFSQYWKWFTGVLRGDFGFSFRYNRPVASLIWSRLGFTVFISVSTMLFTWVVAFPLGVYSAVKQHSIGDYAVSIFGYLGLATPNFMIALILMYAAFKVFGTELSGLFSSEFVNAPWSFARLVDLLKHLPIPIIVIGTAGTAGLIRVLRNNLLDQLGKDYVTTARAKGVSETRLLFKYPVRLAINPFISTAGWMLPALISGEAITGIVLSLPTTGPLLLNALLEQDMFLAGSFILLLATLTVIGTVLSDILLIVVDPRIKYK